MRTAVSKRHAVTLLSDSQMWGGGIAFDVFNVQSQFAPAEQISRLPGLVTRGFMLDLLTIPEDDWLMFPGERLALAP